MAKPGQFYAKCNYTKNMADLLRNFLLLSFVALTLFALDV